MKYKRVLANDIKEATEQIRLEMGPDAMIVSTKKIRTGGIFGLFKKPLVEVIAIMEEPVIPVIPQVIETKSNEGIDELKDLVHSLIERVDHLTPAQTPTEEESTSDPQQEAYYDFLVSRRIQPQIARRMVNIAARQVSFSDENKEHVLSTLRHNLAGLLGQPETIANDAGVRPNIYVFLGPTGVGKTTTLSKMAAELAVNRKSIGIITLDTYRIAAVEQIRTYSNILQAPLEVVYDVEGLRAALHKFREMEYIFVDTAGRGHKTKELKEDYDTIAECIKDPNIFLLLNVSIDFRELKNIIASYGFLPKFRLLFTKLDEASNFANILNVRVLSGMPLSYFTNGQVVPDDMIIADADIVLDSIFKSVEGDDGSGPKT